MNKCVAAALTIAITIGPASALDVGLGGKVGSVGVSAGVSVGSKGTSVAGGASVEGVGGASLGGSAKAGVSVGSKGASVAGGASVDGVGGASLGGSVSAGNGSLGAGLGVSGNLGGASGGLSTGTSVGDHSSGSGTAPGGSPGGPAVGSGQVLSGSAGITPAIAKANAARISAVLPRALRPSEAGRGELALITKGYPYPLGFLAPLKAKPGTPQAVVRACRTAIASAATPLGAVRVHAVSAGPLRQERRGALTARIEVRIHYARQGGIEVRRARVGCRLDAAGRVIAVT
ncbi:hypothetical protein [Mesorhizobium sp.]|uniref:hypothetical protein n=1 Tax=Mesorhizobium sp. TaxID=1871066 RepID=UPI000FE523F1|nr:hypothetical protein [Mesorhizobium sp.]RWK63123.1 MAG: hypothetical protein EOR49_10350 [Mesorhizobium sp.]RWM50149.1 MAG: hypothetical protein EOR76_07805 [Mesorhizobium sp.]RWM57109.1 MAG: hypothetical protein EOR78_11090 [Mesorhizobium sp.]RWM58481.1 MAG: hypothetical protein EOR79_13555 [Mesorhizobium sp.]RWN04428.1 MAG: hypothetical protein EOR85_06775 [Mesorhizobium sp.]